MAPASGDEPRDWQVEPGDHAALLATRPWAGTGTLWETHSPQSVDHYAADPRPRCTVTIRSPAGDVVGVASLVDCPMMTSRGAETVRVVDALAMHAPEVDALRALRQHSRRYPTPIGPAQPVTVPSTAALPPTALRPAGLRETGGRFIPYLATADPDHPFLTAARTNLGVV
jgi:hypothetical protein